MDRADEAGDEQAKYEAAMDEEAKCTTLEKLVDSLRADLSQRIAELAQVRTASAEAKRAIRSELYEAKDALQKELLEAQEESRAAAGRERALRELCRQRDTELELARASHSSEYQALQHQHSELRSGTTAALKACELHVKTAELESSRLARELVLKGDDLLSVSTQLEDAMADISSNRSNSSLAISSHSQRTEELDGAMRQLAQEHSACKGKYAQVQAQLVASVSAAERERTDHLLALEVASNAARVAKADLAQQMDITAELQASLLDLQQRQHQVAGEKLQSTEARQRNYESQISELSLRVHEATLAAEADGRAKATAQAEVGRLAASLAASHEQWEREKREAADEVGHLRAERDAAQARLAAIQLTLQTAQNERDQLHKALESEAKRRVTLEMAHTEKVKWLGSTTDTCRRKTDRQDNALEQLRERVKEMEMADASTSTEHSRERQLLLNQVHTAELKAQGLQRELSAVMDDMSKVEGHNTALKMQVAVVEAEAKSIQIRFATMSSKLGVPPTTPQRAQLNEASESLRQRLKLLQRPG